MPGTSLKISDPRFNVREIAKQLVLLEQHLLEDGKYCPDCITKHILTVEALAEECQSLDKMRVWCPLSGEVVARAQNWARCFKQGVPPAVIGQDVRAVRKQMQQAVLSPEFGDAVAVEAQTWGNKFAAEMTRKTLGLPTWVLLCAAAVTGYYTRREMR